MKSDKAVRRSASLRRVAGTIVFAIAAGLASTQRIDASASASAGVVLWDTVAPFTGTTADGSRNGWVAVPSETVELEADPLKAASDPGYWGREYSFKGDAVVENHSLTAVCWSAKGRVVIYAKEMVAAEGGAAQRSPGFGNKILEFAPQQTTSRTGKIARCEVLRNSGDEVVLSACFSAAGTTEIPAVFSFGRDGIVEIKPAEGAKGIVLFSPIEYGVVPAFVGDDLIVGPADCASADAVALPVENVFMGLLKGQSSELVLTWPKGKQELKLNLSKDQLGMRVVESVDFDNDGQSVYVAALSAPGIWHREELKPAFLEKDVALTWKRPFAARWKTQLTESGMKTTYAFREAKGTVWRGVPGSYLYPVWFDGEKACYHLSKKVPPKGESIIYYLEGQDTPVSVATPVDIMKATLGRQMCESILDVAGRKLRTHHRRGGDGVHRACTCGCTETIQAFFEAGKEVANKDDIKEALADMNYFVECHVARIEEYLEFAGGMIQFLKEKQAAAPESRPFLESLEQIVQQIPQENDVQKENMKSREYAADLTRQTIALTAGANANNLAACKELVKEWRAMGGAQDYVVAQCHMVARKLFQEAGYGCISDPAAVPLAREVRARCRQVLRNPDGYEIWANY